MLQLEQEQVQKLVQSDALPIHSWYVAPDTFDTFSILSILILLSLTFDTLGTFDTFTLSTSLALLTLLSVLTFLKMLTPLTILIQLNDTRGRFPKKNRKKSGPAPPIRKASLLVWALLGYAPQRLCPGVNSSLCEEWIRLRCRCCCNTPSLTSPALTLPTWWALACTGLAMVTMGRGLAGRIDANWANLMKQLQLFGFGRLLEHAGAEDLLEVRDAEGRTPFMVALQVVQM